MAEQAEGTIEIEATPKEIMGVIADFEAYPEWSDVKAVTVKDRDPDGRAKVVAFEVGMMGFTAKYSLEYEYQPDDAGVSWTTADAEGAVTDVEGEYVLEAQNGATMVTYRLTVEVAVPAPGFIKRQAEKMIIKNALHGLKERVEGG
jgi:carbon monoxide dehydrogenase subunit G